MPAAGGCGIAFRNICAGSILGAGGGAPGFIGSGGSGRLGLNCSTSGCNIAFTGAQDSNVGFGDTLFQLQLSAERGQALIDFRIAGVIWGKSGSAE